MDVTEDDIAGWRASCSNWGRWGDEDRLGTLNLIDAAVRREAVATVTEGVAVSCSRPVPKATDHGGATATVHLMVRTLSRHVASDYLGLAAHGQEVTHLDALCHFSSQGSLYNGFEFDSAGITPRSELGVDVSRDGILTRGVLVDLPRALGRAALEPGEAVSPGELQRALETSGVTLRPGDALLVRTGRWSRRRAGDQGTETELAGLHPGCLPWLHEQDISVLGCDGITDVLPPVVPGVRLPIHEIALARMGLQLLDNLDLDAVGELCARLGRWEFLFIVAPLVIASGTASPVNPIALF
jgi:kynurenine formamidase